MTTDPDRSRKPNENGEPSESPPLERWPALTKDLTPAQKKDATKLLLRLTGKRQTSQAQDLAPREGETLLEFLKRQPKGTRITSVYLPPKPTKK